MLKQKTIGLFNKKISTFYCSQTTVTNNSVQLRAKHRKRTNSVSHNFDRKICCSISSISEINTNHGKNNKIMSSCRAEFVQIRFNASLISENEYIDMMLSKHWANLNLVFTIASLINYRWWLNEKHTANRKTNSVELRIYKNKNKRKAFAKSQKFCILIWLNIEEKSIQEDEKTWLIFIRSYFFRDSRWSFRRAQEPKQERARAWER